jgi:hypothetical protein
MSEKTLFIFFTILTIISILLAIESWKYSPELSAFGVAFATTFALLSISSFSNWREEATWSKREKRRYRPSYIFFTKYLEWLRKYGKDTAIKMRNISEYFYDDCETCSMMITMLAIYRERFMEIFEMALKTIAYMDEKERDRYIKKLRKDIINENFEEFTKHTTEAIMEIIGGD